MPVLTNQTVPQAALRTYHVHVPANPAQAAVPAIVVFHGGGQDVQTIMARWGLVPGSPIPAAVADYLLVFPESHPDLGREWIHYGASNTGFPTLDVEFVDLLLTEITTTGYLTGSAAVPKVSADPDLVYTAGFSNGAGMVWQLANHTLVDAFRGFATVGKALDPEKSQRYRRQLAASGAQPAAVPLFYVHGTADHTFRSPAGLHEVDIETTFPAFSVRDMLDRNGVSAGMPATTTDLVPGSANLTEVLVQTFVGTEAFANATIVNGGHNWPTPTTVGNPPVATHWNATGAIIDFWQAHAGLP